MRADFDFYVRNNTWLHRLDPRVKFLFAAEAALVLFLLPTVWTALAALLVCGLALWSARVPGRQVVWVWRMIAPLMFFVFLLTALFGAAPGEPAWLRLGPAVITPEAVQRGVMLALRLLALALIFFSWLFTTDQAAMMRGFIALRMPYSWGLTLALALRYLPVFAGLFNQVQEAQQARGLDLEQGRFWQRLRRYRPVLVSMIIIAVRQSEQLGWALEARALGAAGVRRTLFRPLRMTRIDWLVTGLLLVILLAALGLRLSRTV